MNENNSFLKNKYQSEEAMAVHCQQQLIGNHFYCFNIQTLLFNL